MREDSCGYAEPPEIVFGGDKASYPPTTDRVTMAALPVRKCRYFITLSLSAGEDPGWVARVCGTSEQMIFRHYRNWIPGLQTGAGATISALFRRLSHSRIT